MNHQYRIINQCVRLLKQSFMPAEMKLRVETQLIQIKRILLDEAICSEIKCGSHGEEMFEDLLCQMIRACGGSCEGDDLDNLMNRIGAMLAVYGARFQNKESSQNPVGLSLT